MENELDLELWGATEADEQISPAPEMRRIGERLFVRTAEMPRGKAARLPLRIKPDLMKRLLPLNAVDQVEKVIDELADDRTKAVWSGLDFVDRLRVAKRYHDEVVELFGMVTGESVR